jgi:hypothetical protein
MRFKKTIAACAVAGLVLTAAPAVANTIYPNNLNCEGICTVINDDGVNVVRIKLDGPSHAWSDAFDNWIANHDDGEIQVCVKARTNRGVMSPTVSGGGSLGPGAYWAIWLPNVGSSSYSVVCGRMFLPNNAAQRIKIGPSGSGDGNLLVRYVQLTDPGT